MQNNSDHKTSLVLSVSSKSKPYFYCLYYLLKLLLLKKENRKKGKIHHALPVKQLIQMSPFLLSERVCNPNCAFPDRVFCSKWQIIIQRMQGDGEGRYPFTNTSSIRGIRFVRVILTNHSSPWPFPQGRQWYWRINHEATKKNIGGSVKQVRWWGELH